MEQQVICIDCEEQWDPLNEPNHCICDYPQVDAWVLYIGGEWEGTYRETYY